MHRSLLRSLSVSLALALASCANVPQIEGEPAAIVGGTVDTGDPNVYYLLIGGVGSCTAELISPHVVLTARHCLVNETTDAMVPASQLTLFVGGDFSSFTTRYRAASTHIIPNSSNVIGIGGGDLGLIILRDAAHETPLTISRQDYHMMDGQSFTAIGYGQTPMNLNGGRKYRATGMVTSTSGGYLRVNNVICEGDSGGPMIGPDGNVWGVTSFGVGTAPDMPPTCGNATGAYNALFDNLTWIDSILEMAGDLCIMRPEICDGIDNDCNGVADEGCLVLGDACTDAARCTSGHCETTADGMICTTPCDATRPGVGCGNDFHCVHSDGCTGWCLPGTSGTLGVGAPCTSDDACESGSCVDPMDHVRRCLALCFGESGQCASGEVCTAAAGACGACVPSAIFGSAHGLGEECTTDASCRSGHCLARAGVHECVSLCDAATPCGDGYVCEGEYCVLDRAQPPGGVCHDIADCLGGICITEGARGWCTPADCTTNPCGAGFVCSMVSTSNVCTPMLALAGESCANDAACTTGMCTMGVCSATCTEANDCGAGLRCVRGESGTDAHCLPPAAPPASGGCSVSTARSSGGSRTFMLFALGMLALGLVVRARKR